MKTVMLRLGFFLPVILFTVYVFLAVFGIVAEAFGAGDVFYCTVYCKMAIAILVVAVAATVYGQLRSPKGAGR